MQASRLWLYFLKHWTFIAQSFQLHKKRVSLALSIDDSQNEY